MHGAAAPPGASRLLAQDLGEQSGERSAAGQIVAVRAVAAPHGILRAERRADSRGDRLLANIEVARAPRLAAFDQLGDALLGPPDPQHGAPQVPQRSRT